MDSAASHPRLADEAARLASLRSYAAVSDETREKLDLLADVAAQVCGTAFAFVTLVESEQVNVAACNAAVRRTAPHAWPRNASACSLAMTQPSHRLYLPDLSARPDTAALYASGGAQRPYGMYFGANLISNFGNPIGTLCVMDEAPRALTEGQQQLVAGLAQQVMLVLELHQREVELAEALTRLAVVSSADELTGLLNQSTLMRSFEREARRSARDKTPLSALMLGLDRFAQVNDHYGRPAGDAVLKQLARLLEANVRATDTVARYGGDEMAVLLPNTSIAGAVRLAEKLRDAVIGAPIATPAGPVQLTVSIGAVTLEPSSPIPVEALLQAAGASLRLAKERGRNRVVAPAFH